MVIQGKLTRVMLLSISLGVCVVCVVFVYVCVLSLLLPQVPLGCRSPGCFSLIRSATGRLNIPLSITQILL